METGSVLATWNLEAWTFVVELAVTCFVWGMVAGCILHRGMKTGRWSLLP